MGALRRAAAGAGEAVAFLTVLPVRIHGGREGAAAAPAWFPFVGALVGALAGGTRLLAEPAFGVPVATVLAVVVLVVVTGALHQDGLADCADGLGVRGDRERRLAAMRDSATGVFGALALLGWALLLTTALAGLSDAEAFRALVTAGAVGRWAALLHARAVPPARSDGLGAGFAVGPLALAFATATAAAVAFALDGAIGGAASLAAGALVAAAVALWSRRTLGGLTGDTLGATVALAELAVCLTLLGLD